MLPFRVSSFRLPKLYPILDTAAYESHGFDVVSAAETLLEAGAGILQYRHKAAFTASRREEASEIAALCQSRGALFVVNDRVDIAAQLNSAVHLGQQDLSPAEARSQLKPGAFIGLSTHNEVQVSAAAELPVDYIAFGPVFGTNSKKNPDPEVGLDELRRVCPHTKLPVVAIGGIRLDQAAAVLAAGAGSIAVISGLLGDARDLQRLRRSTEDWLNALTA